MSSDMSMASNTQTRSTTNSQAFKLRDANGCDSSDPINNAAAQGRGRGNRVDVAYQAAALRFCNELGAVLWHGPTAGRTQRCTLTSAALRDDVGR